ncbi:metabotropic glutamate receptor 1-like isoform X5 [Oratosquilla oratoria]|uniref:metabotropic glutamate receptor 1-like isoform X5 n=1 Tax=Oratosquilla oratoria TaxID=337810 RepID=UPI003F76D5FA
MTYRRWPRLWPASRGGEGALPLLLRLLLPLLLLLLLPLCDGVEGNLSGAHTKQRKTALLDGDILIGALFSVHHQPKQKTAFTRTCGMVREQYGIQRVEAAFLAIDEINSRTDLLPNITLGVEIRDSCWYSSIALEQSIEFIRDAISSSKGGVEKRKTEAGNYTSCEKKTNKNLVGVVGPGSSAVTIQVQNLLQLFSIPQVGYSATSKDLSDKSRFPYFMRVVPSDYYQAQVMVDLVRRYNWTYVSAVHTDGNYGQSGMTAFRELAERNNICIAKEDSVLSNAEDEAFDEVIRQLLEDQKARVVVCFCEGMTVRHLLIAAQRNNVTSRFLFLGSDGWADRSDVVEGLESAALGGLSIRIQAAYVQAFDPRYFGLRPDNNTRNPWFQEFWQRRFNCSLKGEDMVEGLPPCTGEESLQDKYKQDTKMAFVMKAIYAMAHGLHDMWAALCPDEPGLCDAMRPINGSLYWQYLMNVTFPFMNETVSFDARGDPPGRYDIMNYQRLQNGSYEYVHVGTWDNGSLTLHSPVVFKTSDGQPPNSVCSEPCGLGQVKSFVDTGDSNQRCCWICADCKDDEYQFDESTCSRCHNDSWPNANRTGCDPRPVEHSLWTDDSSLVSLCLGTLGFLATSFTMGVFIRYNHTPVVKASTRELSYLIFFGMMIAYGSTLPLVARPTRITCSLTRIMPGLSFSMIYASLFTKTNRIARILAGNKKIITSKPRFMSATAQVVITLLLISIELGIIVGMLIHQPALVDKDYSRANKVVLICNTTPLGIMAPMSWVFVLIVLCTIYAIKTRNLPENFNEAKFIGFSMYTTCVIWVAWFPIYFGSDHKIICMCVCTSLSAIVTLVLLFFPKLYIILFRPDKNDRSAFKTATTVRCHFGSTAQNNPSRTSGSISDQPAAQPSCRSSVRLITAPRPTFGQRLRARLRCGPDGKEQPALRGFLQRDPSVWSDVSGSATGMTNEMMLKRAYGSQLDLRGRASSGGERGAAGEEWWMEERGSQTTDDLLDPLIPRLRRRVAKAVREMSLPEHEARSFFSLTQPWMTAQAEAARLHKRMDSQRSSESEEPPQPPPSYSSVLKGSTEESTLDEDNSSIPPGGEKGGETATTTTTATAAVATSSSSTAASPHSPAMNIEDKRETSVCVAQVCERTVVIEKCEPSKASSSESSSVVGCHVDRTHREMESVQKCSDDDEKVTSRCQEEPPAMAASDVCIKGCVVEPGSSSAVGYGSNLPRSLAWRRTCSAEEHRRNGASVTKEDRKRVVSLHEDGRYVGEGIIRENGDPWGTYSQDVSDTENQMGTNGKTGCHRKVVAAPKIQQDVRGILKSESFSKTTKENHVSFETQGAAAIRTNAGGGGGSGSVVALRGPSAAAKHDFFMAEDLKEKLLRSKRESSLSSSESEDCVSRILEEPLSEDSDLEPTGECEMKNIIISLGSREGSMASDSSSDNINWRPKPGGGGHLLPALQLNEDE